MNINYKQPQFELFPANSATLEDVNKPRFLLAHLTLSIESLVILVILGIMVALFSFSLGVERGKHLTAQALDERVTAAWNVGNRAPQKAVEQAAKALPVVAVPVTSAAKPVTAVVPHRSQGNGGIVTASKPVAAPVALKATPAAAATVKPGRLTIQVGSYKSEAYAKQEALNIKAKGLDSFLIKKGDFWLVCVGQFSAATAAKGTLKKLQPKYRDLSVRRF